MSNSPVATTDFTPACELPQELQNELQRIQEVSSLPEVTARIVQVVEDPKATAHDMHEIVRTDPALAAKILKVVNSAFYGLPSQIASLDRAILMLGLSAVKNIALAASLSRLFKADAVSEQFAARDLWRHCIAVGVCARLLGQRTCWAQSDEAFVAGLVHDLGLIVAQQLFPDCLNDIAERCYNTPQDFCAVERELLGADHQAVGQAIAARWKFPPGLQAVISHHHRPLELPVEFQRMAATIFVADALCCRAQHGFWLSGQTQEINEAVLKVVGIEAEQLDSVLDELPERVDEAERIFTD